MKSCLFLFLSKTVMLAAAWQFVNIVHSRNTLTVSFKNVHVRYNSWYISLPSSEKN